MKSLLALVLGSGNKRNTAIIMLVVIPYLSNQFPAAKKFLNGLTETDILAIIQWAGGALAVGGVIHDIWKRGGWQAVARWALEKIKSKRA